MPRFRSIGVYPSTVMWGAPWSDDPDSDAFLRFARGVCEVYSDAVAGAGLQHPVSSLVIYTHEEPPQHRDTIDEGQTVVQSPVDPDPVRVRHESAVVRVVRGFAAMEPDAQRRVVVEAVHAAGVGLARHRALPVDVFEGARSAVLRAAPDLGWATPWAASPDGRWRARCRFRTLRDGFGRQVLEVSARDGGGSLFSPEVIASAAFGDQRRAGATLRWKPDGRLQVSLCTSYRGPGVGALTMSPAAGIHGELAAPGCFGTFEEAAAEPDSGPVSPVETASAGGPRSDVLLLLPEPSVDRWAGDRAAGGPTSRRR